MAPKKKSEKTSIFVELLQNGNPVTRFCHPLAKRKSIFLSSQQHSPLSIPFYPLSSEIRVFEISKGQALFHTDDILWEGFLTSNGFPIDFSKTYTQRGPIPLRKGDFGSLSYKDLRLIFRVGFKHRTHIPSSFRFKKERGKLLSLLVGEKIDFMTLALGLFLAALTVACFVFWLMFYSTFSLPKKISDLSSSFVIPFVSGEHIQRAPEALQDNLDRTNLLSSIVQYYLSFSAMITGSSEFDEQFLFPTSIDLYDNLYRKVESQKEAKIAAQIAVDQEQLRRQGAAVISVPSVVGESIKGTSLRLLDKTSLLHKSLDYSLKHRKEISALFPKDPSYDYSKYKDMGIAENALLYLGKIKPWEPTDIEYVIFKETNQLAVKAKFSHKRRLKNRSSKDFLTRDSYNPPIAIPTGAKFVSFLEYEKFPKTDEKINGLHGSTFGESEKKIEEPLVGEIEPHLIETTIKKYRYELQLCFELALRRNRSLAGEMEWRWKIDSRGNISDINLISSSIKDQKMVTCVQAKIATWRFPRPRRGSVEITYPFEFKSAKKG